MTIKLYTIGFTKKSAREFFELLCGSGAKRVLDVRLHNVSQLAGFAKKDDLAYFLDRICGMSYHHLPELAPTEEILEEYRKRGRNWATYERRFLELMEERRIEERVSPELIAGGCLLCSEDRPERCHRRLVAEYLQKHWGNVEVHHLV